MNSSGQNSIVDFCVLIPCYNNQEGLLQSLETVHYTAGKFHVVVVDDGSATPVSKEQVLLRVGTNFPISILRLEKNKGITHALNHGLQWIYNNLNCKYVARLDCNDTCHRDRFYKQIQSMDANPLLLLSGVWCRFIREDGYSFIYKTPISRKGIWRGMYFRNLFIHPGIMFRHIINNSLLQYSDNYPHAEDYALAWTLMKTGEVTILDEVLVNCTINTKGISESNRKIQIHSRKKIVQRIAVNNILGIIARLYLFFLQIIPRKLILAYKLRK